MQLDGPQTYKLTITKTGYSVTAPTGENNFIKPATSKIPKLYVISKDSKLIYIGVTKQSISSRLRYGFSADGAHGYHGYSWRRTEDVLRLDIWSLHGSEEEESSRELETVEAETVYLFRKLSNQWPAGQTEIHFHPSKEFHRQCAERIIASFNNV